MPRRPFAASLPSCALALALPALAAAAPGGLDSTFGDGGRVRTGFGGGIDAGNAVALQTDGKTVVAGASASGRWFAEDFLLLRHHPDGSLDISFGDGGRVITSFGTSIAVARAVAIQSDGRILAGGDVDGHFAVARYLADGSLDPSFDGDGMRIVETEWDASGRAMVLQSDGKILLAGSLASVHTYAAVIRLNPDGSLDPTFDTDGMVNFAHFDDCRIHAIGVLNGKIILAGEASQGATRSILLARLNADGSFDSTFDGDGRVTTYVGSEAAAYGLALQLSATAPPKVLLAGEANNGSNQFDVVVLRYLDNGALDPGFDSDGLVVFPLSSQYEAARAIRVRYSGGQPSRIFVTGVRGAPSHAAMPLTLKLTLGGALDTTFGGVGYVVHWLGQGASANALMLTNTGGVLVVGSIAGGSGAGDVVLARYLVADGTLDPTFDGDGIRFEDCGDNPAVAEDVLIQSDGRIVAAGTATLDVREFGVARYLADGTLDDTFGTAGRATVWFGQGSDWCYAAALQDDDRIVLAGQARSDGHDRMALARLTVDGSLDPTFGDGDGLVTAGNSEYVSGFANDVAVQADGGIVAVGGAIPWWQSFDVAVAVRLRPEGVLDPDFGLWGFAHHPATPDGALASACAVQPDGRIVVAGSSPSGFGSFFVLRLTASGQPDSSFSGDGILQSTFGTLDNLVWEVTLQPDGCIVVVGGGAFGSPGFGVARFLPNGSPDTSFDGDGKLSLASAGGVSLSAATDVKVLAGGRILASALAGGDFALVRLLPDGSVDEDFGTGGLALVDFAGATDSAHSLAIDGSGRAVLTGSASGLFGVARVLGDPLSTGAPAGDRRFAGFRMLAPWPNPTAGTATLGFTLEAPARMTVEVFDVAGRRVRVLAADAARPAGSHRLSWDARDAAGLPVSSGVYLIRATAGEERQARRLTVLR